MIYQTITDPSHFARWIQQSDTYKNNFTWDGARALQEHLEDLSEDLDDDMEFDPIAWCCEYSEYTSALEAYNQHHGIDDPGTGTSIDEDNTPENAETQALEWLQDNTTVIEFNGGIIVQDF